VRFPVHILFFAVALCVRANPVDELLDRYWKENGITPPAPVSDAQFARRAYLDVWGLLPDPAQLDEFVRDSRPDKRARLVGKLLADDQLYADHWITFWNDHLRNDEGLVFHGERESITAWLHAALKSNLPYDRFVRALIDPREKTDPRGFLIGVNWRGEVNASQTPVMQAAQNTAQVFLGVNLKCNSCHDSFISKWKLADAYGLAGFFSDAPLEVYRCDAATGKTAPVKFLFPELGSVDGAAPLAAKREVAARLFTMPENRRTPRVLVNRYWKVLFGRGLVEPVDEMDRKPWSGELLDRLADEFVADGSDMKRLLLTLMTSRAYALSADADPPKPYVFRGPAVRRLSAEQFSDAVSAITGEWRISVPRSAAPPVYVREWRLKSSALSRALGRPMRDQVITERLQEATTLQALELANGAELARRLELGAARMTGRLQPAPKPLFDSGVVARDPVKFDVDPGRAKRLWLLIEDVDSYDITRTKAGWLGLDGARGDGEIQVKGAAAAPAIVMPVNSMRAVEIRQGARFAGMAGVDEASLASDINPRIRFFIFGEEPDRERLFEPSSAPPLPRPPVVKGTGAMIERIYEHALSREPSAAERKAAGGMLKGGKAEAVEDLLWSVLMSPEFQYVR
jgi:hypothetical protein